MNEIDDLAQISKYSSKEEISQLTKNIIEGGAINIHKLEAFNEVTARTYQDVKHMQAANDENNLPMLSIERKIAMEQKLQQECLTWLTVASTYENEFSMTPNVFREAGSCSCFGKWKSSSKNEV